MSIFPQEPSQEERETQELLIKYIEANQKYYKAISTIEQIVRGQIKHVNHHARLLHILDVIEDLQKE